MAGPPHIIYQCAARNQSPIQRQIHTVTRKMADIQTHRYRQKVAGPPHIIYSRAARNPSPIQRTYPPTKPEKKKKNDRGALFHAHTTYILLRPICSSLRINVIDRVSSFSSLPSLSSSSVYWQSRVYIFRFFR